MHMIGLAAKLIQPNVPVLALLAAYCLQTIQHGVREALSSVFCDQHQMVFQAVDAMMMRFHCIDTKLYFSKD